MSDLQDIIASSSIHAFNSGVRAGKEQQRAYIVGLLKLKKATWEEKETLDYLEELDILIRLIQNQD